MEESFIDEDEELREFPETWANENGIGWRPTSWLIECCDDPELIDRLTTLLTAKERDRLDPRPYRAGWCETEDVCTYCGRQPEGDALVIDNRPHGHDMNTAAVLCTDCLAVLQKIPR
jgi:hypothetical protein